MYIQNMLRGIVLSWCTQQHITLAGKTILCAVSGGQDSMALLHVLLDLGKNEGFAVAVAHYNHQLRETATQDEALVRHHCATLGVPFFAGSGDVRGYAKAHSASIEDAARTMRYAFLQHTAQECGADYIATAHHRQDNAETLLLHLLRGSGLHGLGGIAPVRENIIRPLLQVDRTEIEQYIAKYQIPYAEDESNQDTIYTRNRLRLEVLPLLEAIASGSVGRMADTAQRLRTDEAFFQQYCAKLLPDNTTELPLAVVQKQHPAIASRLVRMVAQRCGVTLTATQTDAVLTMRRGACLSLHGGLRVAHEGTVLHFFRPYETGAPLALTIGEHDWGAWRVKVWETCEEVAQNAYTVMLRGGLHTIELTAWDGTGRLGVENGRRTVKRLLTDHGIPPAQRENCPAIYVEGVLAAVFGAGTDIAFRPVRGEKQLVITIKKKSTEQK